MQSKAKGPTKAERERFAEIAQIGCLPCWVENFQFRQPDIQHIVDGGKRLGHSHTYGCCPWHHRGVPPNGYTRHDCDVMLGPSFAFNSRKYHDRYGTEKELMALQDECLRSLKGGSSTYSLLRAYRASRGVS